MIADEPIYSITSKITTTTVRTPPRHSGRAMVRIISAETGSWSISKSGRRGCHAIWHPISPYFSHKATPAQRHRSPSLSPVLHGLVALRAVRQGASQCPIDGGKNARPAGRRGGQDRVNECVQNRPKGGTGSG